MINHISRQSRSSGTSSGTGGIAIRRPVHHARQGVARRRPAGDGRRPHLPAQARRAVLDHHDRGHRRDGDGLDVLRHRRLVGADRPRRHLRATRAPDHRLAAAPSPITACGSSGSMPSATSSRRPGTSCFMVEPEIYEFLEWITGVADWLGLVVLPEVHDGTRPTSACSRTATGRTTSSCRAFSCTPSKQATPTDWRRTLPVRPSRQFTTPRLPRRHPGSP